jgi:hypothetical protein
MPKTVGSKKVAAPLRQSPGAAVEKVAPVSGAQIEAVVVGLVCDIGAMIDDARKQVSVTANAARGLDQPFRVRGLAEGHRSYLPWLRDRVFSRTRAA